MFKSDPVNLPYGTLQNFCENIEKNCCGEWKIDYIAFAGEYPGTYIFSFEDERDWLIFKLSN